MLGRALKGKIQALREEYLKPLVNGQASDYPDYKARTGYLKALKDFEKLIDDFNADDERQVYGAFGSISDRPRT